MTRPGPPVSVQRASALKLGIPNSEVVEAVHECRRKIWERDFPHAIFGSSGILSDEIVESLASVGPILSLIQLEKVVGENWPWFGKYGDELLEVFKKMTIPPLQPKPKQPRGQKKALDERDRDDERTTKRSRTDTSHTSSSKKPAQIPDPSTGPVTHLPPATPLPHNPYTHLLTPGSSPYLNYQPQPNYQYYFNTTPQFSVSDQHVNICQHTIINNIASSSRTTFPPLNSQFRAYNPQNLK